MFNDDFLTKLYIWKDLIMGLCLLVVLLCTYFSSCSTINEKAGLENDNIFEQSVEKLIESELGIELDLTPNDDI